MKIFGACIRVQGSLNLNAHYTELYMAKNLFVDLLSK